MHAAARSGGLYETYLISCNARGQSTPFSCVPAENKNSQFTLGLSGLQFSIIIIIEHYSAPNSERTWAHYNSQ